MNTYSECLRRFLLGRVLGQTPLPHRSSLGHSPRAWLCPVGSSTLGDRSYSCQHPGWPTRLCMYPLDKVPVQQKSHSIKTAVSRGKLKLMLTLDSILAFKWEGFPATFGWSSVCHQSTKHHTCLMGSI